MSKIKIVKKKGHYVRKHVRRSIPWRDEMLSLMNIRGNPYSRLPKFMDAFPDTDFLTYLLFLTASEALTRGFVYSTVRPIHESRGFSYHLYGEVSSLRMLYSRISQLITHNWDKWSPWVLALDLRSVPSPRFSMYIDMRIYPPLDSVTYAACRLLYQECTPEGQTTASDMLNFMATALERDLAKKSREMKGEVSATIHV
jgi:hypothetical protein